ncbi:MAG: MurR/RpiR family transcriptional regulator, partial [Anaerolineales bacterium]|nr:MurR/RpiR family transcriptional regulator [Anaerolineales bacterium]
LSIIRGFYSSLSISEKKVADYILANLPDTIRMTLADVGHESGVSDATVLRFCRSIGYKRWLEFKVDLIRTLPGSPEQILDDVDSNDSPGLIAKKVFNSSIQALTDTLTVLDDAGFVQALELIADADKILIIGVGTSGPMAKEMHNRLLRLGLNCHVQTDSYIQVMESALLTAMDIIIVISQTGDSEDPLRTTALAKSKGCGVIVITGNTGSKLTEYANVVLLSVSHETRAETIASRIAQYAIIYALYVGLAMRDISSTVEKEQLIWDAMMNKVTFQSFKQ